VEASVSDARGKLLPDAVSTKSCGGAPPVSRLDPTLLSSQVSLERMPGSDAELVAEALRGQPAAFEALVRRHLRAAFAIALARTGNPQDAEDVCQDAFVAALERLAELKAPDRFVGWLLRIVRNRALNTVRARSLHAAEPLEAAEGTGATEDDGPATAAERIGLRADLLEALGTLTETQREVVLLHDVDGWRHAEIAERLDMPEGTVRYYVHQARSALRARLDSRYASEIG
jgi:RNA polymerase sigma-70 factor (ECF subfamily)